VRKSHILSNDPQQVLPLANELLYSKIRMRAVEFRRPGSSVASIVLQNNLKPALFSEFVLPSIHLSSTDKACTGRIHSSLNTIFNFFSRITHFSSRYP
jgi:hypothetical protein